MREAAEGSYQLIFMDVQMPEMNGLDATRAIRKLENPWASSIPIIAMTADAFSENVMECLNAGMNGHIAKPVDIKLVIKEIRRIKEERSIREKDDMHAFGGADDGGLGSDRMQLGEAAGSDD